MTDFDKRKARLEQALARLDRASAGLVSAEEIRAVARERDSLRREVESLNEQNAQLTAALKAMEGQHNRLMKAAGAVSDRLDGVIGDVKSVLDQG